MKKNSMYYMRLCQKTMIEISMTPGTQGKRFLILKKKAQKYLEKAKQLVILEDIAKQVEEG